MKEDLMGSAGAPAVEVTGLTKRHTDVVAVDDVGLSVQESQIYALLGLNGAGKTTLIRMLLGMIAPTAGAARVLGTPVPAGPWPAARCAPSVAARP
ncbi:ATP-binding cassette domain-containing protein [Nonomuraea sp. NPDC049400]|uniref:ATP-binding cassette domain-containing protein n=1 Tax=Nonomuraea sp. NPDC049400 TaxID=3364352 RepID=UPI00378B3E28